MKQDDTILDRATRYIEKYGLEISPEELFVQFMHIVELHEKFNAYLTENNHNQRLEQMKRNERLLEKRKLFAEWYMLRNQNRKMVKEILTELSELVFASTKTMRNDISRETTA